MTAPERFELCLDAQQFGLDGFQLGRHGPAPAFDVGDDDHTHEMIPQHIRYFPPVGRLNAAPERRART